MREEFGGDSSRTFLSGTQRVSAAEDAGLLSVDFFPLDSAVFFLFFRLRD